MRGSALSRLSLCALIGFLTPATAPAQNVTASTDDGSAPMVTAVALEAEERIELDGRLDEPIWQRVEPATNFIQQEPDNGAPATERTEVRIVYDDDRLYLGVILYDSDPAGIMGTQMQRDAPLSSDDRFMWSIDTFLDGRSGYFFEINPLGLMGDGLISQGGGFGIGGGGGFGGGGGGGFGGGVNKQWDGIWIARVRQTDTGWTAEIELPFRTLNFDPTSRAWGINFQRTVRRKSEESVWSGFARNQGLFRMTNAGRVTGLGEMSQGTGLDLKPYAAASVTSAPGRDETAATGTGDVGLDVLYSLTSSLRMNFTVNTDFAETEVDQRRVNLTRFPLFFPEKRDFFLEGSGFFDFGREPGPAVVPFFSRRIGLGADGSPQKIDFGLKLTGQQGQNDIGVLHVQTGHEEDTGAIGEEFTVVRLRRRILTQSYFGGVYTRRAQRVSGTQDLHTAGLDFSLSTARFRGDQNLEVSGFWMWNTNTLGHGHSHTYGGRISYPNDLWNGRFGFREHGDAYNPALGFRQRVGFRRWFPVMAFRPRPENHPYIRRFRFETMFELQTDLENKTLERRFNFTLFSVDFHAGDSVSFSVSPSYEFLDGDFEISDGIILPVNTEYRFTRYRIFARSASRRVVSVNGRYENGGFFSGDRRQITLDVTARLRPGLTAAIEGEWNRLTLAEGEFSTTLYRLVINNQFSPWISMVNNLQYDDVSGIFGWQSRFRWTLKPGNDIFFVYTHNWEENDLDNRFRTLDRRAASKIVYTHRF